MNEALTYHVLQSAIQCGVREFVICPGSRNSSFVEALRLEKRLRVYYWPEERSAAFFALGRSRTMGCPTAVVTTSGTAAGELLPAAMEAHYSGVPLLLITADRPASFRGSGAPQSAEQLNLFGQYAHFHKDISEESQKIGLEKWTQKGAAHLNVCLDEPQSQPKFYGKQLDFRDQQELEKKFSFDQAASFLDRFLEQAKNPLIIVSTLKPAMREAVVRLLLKLKAPLFLEGISGIREDARLQMLSIQRTDKVLEAAKASGYPVDAILRIGGVPTHRIWRDLEYLKDQVKVCAISELPFSGLSWNRAVVCVPVEKFLEQYEPAVCFNRAHAWLQAEAEYKVQLEELFCEEPYAEASLMHELSKIIPKHSHVYLGNSLPIREWDLAAHREASDWLMNASRGLNGIDGQISTFLGLCMKDRPNWAILGDLTAIYDLAGFWIVPQLAIPQISVVIVNNGGGKIFERMYPYKEMLNAHALSFEPLAKLWSLNYSRWESIPKKICSKGAHLIELVPDALATQRFLNKIATFSLLPLKAAL